MKAYKYRLYPNSEQRTLFAKHFGCSRFIYNWGLEQKNKAFAEDRKVSCFDLIKLATSTIKKENEWLKEVNSQSLQMSLRNLDNAFTKFFKKTSKYPKFKNKYTKQSFQCPQNVKVDFDNNRITFPKIPGVKVKFSRRFKGKVKTVTVSQVPSGKYLVSILVDDGLPLPEPCKCTKEGSVGVDLGLKDFAILSTGEKIANPRHIKKAKKQLARAQRKLSRCKKGSFGRARAKQRVAILHEQVTNRRNDFLHKLSKRLIDENQAVCLEDLNVSGMIKNKRLAKHIADVGWRTFRTFCEYKAEMYGKNVKVIGRFEPSSKMCSNCGTINRELKLSDREWTCTCGVIHDRDILAANNILNFAFR